MEHRTDLLRLSIFCSWYFGRNVVHVIICDPGWNQSFILLWLVRMSFLPLKIHCREPQITVADETELQIVCLSCSSVKCEAVLFSHLCHLDVMSLNLTITIGRWVELYFSSEVRHVHVFMLNIKSKNLYNKNSLLVDSVVNVFLLLKEKDDCMCLL